MKAKVWLFFINMLLSASMFAQLYVESVPLKEEISKLPGLEKDNFNVTVLKKNGKPFAEVEIYADGQLLGTTDESGNFTKKINKQGKITLLFKKGSKQFSKTINFFADSIYTINMRLSKPDNSEFSVTSQPYDRIVYNKLRLSDDYISISAFLLRFPNSQYKSQAESLLEATLYRVAQKQNNLKYYMTYLTVFPDGKYAEECKENYDNILFAQAKNINTMQAYKDYIANSPYDYHKNEAEYNAFMLAKQEYEAIVKVNNGSLGAAGYFLSFLGTNEKRDSLEPYKKFLNLFPNSSYALKAQQIIHGAEQTKARQDENKLYKQALDGDIEDCNNYLSKYPNGNYVSEVKDRKEKLTYEYAVDGNISDCNNYLSQYPNGKYVSQIKDRKLYLTVKNSSSVSELNKYLSKFPNGNYANEVRQKRDALIAKQKRDAQIRANSDIRKWQLGYKICRQDYRGIIMGTIEQWNANKTRVQIKIAASPGGMTDEGDMLTKGNTIWVDPKDGWHLCLQDEKEYALSNDKSADFEQYVSNSRNSSKPKFELGSRVCYTVSKTIIPFVYSDDVTICGTVEQWNSSYTKMKVKITSRVYYDDITINGQPVYQGAEIWVSPYGWH